MTGFVEALNNYLLTRNDVPWGEQADVPVRVQIDRAAQVLLTNLQLTPSGAKTRFLRLSAVDYADVRLSLKFTQPGVPSGPLSFAVDVGANGSVDWSYAGTPAFPAVLSSGNLAAAFDAYLAGRTGEVDVPIRIVPSPYLEVAMASASAIPAGKADLALSVADISFSVATPVESQAIEISATLHNSGALASPPFSVAFFAQAPGWGDWYLGSRLIPGIPPGGSDSVAIPWDTLGFAGDLPVKVVLDPYNRVGEGSEANNLAVKNIHIKTRADLLISSLDEPAADLIDGAPATIQMTLKNRGETDAGASIVALYDGNPETGGVLISETSLPALADSQALVAFEWTPTQVGEHRLFVVVDREGVVDEADRSNNLAWKDVVVGLKSPVLLDSGAPGGDPAYDPLTGYGYVDRGLPDVLAACGVGTEPENTLRRDPDGEVVYRFNHLAPSHFYHLDIILYECDGAGRQESILVDGYLYAGPEDLGDGKVHRLSLLVDPALYVDRNLEVVISALGVNGAVTAAVNLHDVDYRYLDAGNAVSDLAYTTERGFGWLDATSIASVAWGKLPYQSLRIDQSDDNLSYQFDRLRADRKYRLHLTFWQKSGAPFLQKVFIDGQDTNLLVNTGDYQLHRETVSVPLEAYQADGSVAVQIQRLGANGAMVNEISLEEDTLAITSGQSVTPTPYFSNVYGSVNVNVTTTNPGEPAPVGTLIQAFDPRGQLVGSYTVTTAGTYGYLRIYGEDDSAVPLIPGMRENELVTFKVNGAPAVARPSFYWSDDHQVHQVDLVAGEINQQAILLSPGWNFISFYYEPPSPLLTNVMQLIYGRYDRVLSETGVYAPNLAEEFITLRELHSGQGYYVRTIETVSLNLLVEGIHQPATTPLNLHQGWNWIGYLPTQQQPIETALASLAGKYQLVHNLLYAYKPDDPLHSTLSVMQPGEGYMIYMNEPATLVYPDPRQLLPQSEVHLPPDLSHLGVQPTPNFMTVYGTVTVNGAPAPAGTLVQVYTPEGQLAGAGLVTIPGVLGYMHVFGEPGGAAEAFQEGEALIFRINGRPADAGNGLAWTESGMTHAVDLTLDGWWMYFPWVSR